MMYLYLGPAPALSCASHARTAAGLSFTGKSHHFSHSGVPGSARKVGISSMSSSSTDRCRMRVNFFSTLPGRSFTLLKE